MSSEDWNQVLECIDKAAYGKLDSTKEIIRLYYDLEWIKDNVVFDNLFDYRGVTNLNRQLKLGRRRIRKILKKISPEDYECLVGQESKHLK